MENDIKTHIQHVIETNLQLTYNQHLEELDTTVSNAILNIELLQQDCIEALHDITQSQQSTFPRSSTNSSPTTELPPPHWQNHPTPSPTKSTSSKMPGRVNWGVPISQIHIGTPTNPSIPPHNTPGCLTHHRIPTPTIIIIATLNYTQSFDLTTTTLSTKPTLNTWDQAVYSHFTINSLILVTNMDYIFSP